MKTKFWFALIVMITMFSLVSAPVFADPGNGGVKKNEDASDTGKTNANGNAGFGAVVTGGGSDDSDPAPAGCPAGSIDVNGDGSLCL